MGNSVKGLHTQLYYHTKWSPALPKEKMPSTFTSKVFSGGENYASIGKYAVSLTNDCKEQKLFA